MLSPQEIAKFIKPEDLEGDAVDIANLVGVENAIKLLMHYEKVRMRFSAKWRLKLVEPYLNAGLWDGNSPRSIALALGISERTVDRMLNRKASKRPDARQLKMDF